MKNDEKRGVSKRTVAILLALVLVIGCAVGGTLAWLTAKTSEVTNTFTYGDINIDLKEHPYDADNFTLKTNDTPVASVDNYKIIPGVDLPKDPKVTVSANSEHCWLFVKVVESGTFVSDKVTYSVDTGWTAGTKTEKSDGNGVPTGVYYREVNASNVDQSFNVLTDNKITVSSELTKDDIKSITGQPTLTFTAYAVQYQKSATTTFSAAEAWGIANPQQPANP